MATDGIHIRIGVNMTGGQVLDPRQQAILDTFDYHRPSPEQGDRIGRVRAAFKRCALTVLACTPAGPDQTAALRQLHESMMTANKAIACEPGTERVEAIGASPEASGDECPRPPPGWRCSREAGHTGPCAASPATRDDPSDASRHGGSTVGIAPDDPNPGC